MKLLAHLVFFLLLVLLPSQFGTHVWFPFSQVLGRRVDYLSLSVTAVDVLLLLGCFFVLVQTKFRVSGKKYWFGLPILIAALHVVLAQNPPLAFLGVLQFIKIPLLLLLIFTLKPSLIQIVLPLSFGIAYTFVLAVAQFLEQSSLGSFWYFLGERTFRIDTPAIALIEVFGRQLLRPYATFPHPNVMGGFMVIVLPFYLLLPTTNKIYFLIRQIVVPMLFFLLFLSFSRAVWVVAFALLLFIFVKRRFLPYLLLLLAFFFSVEELLVGRLVGLTRDSVSITQRAELSQAAVEMIKRYPLFGVGLLNYIPALPTVGVFSLLQPGHSIYLLFLSETGLLGLLLIIFFLKFFIHKWRSIPHPILLSLGSALALGIFDHYLITLNQTRLLFGLVIGLSFLFKNKPHTYET